MLDKKSLDTQSVRALQTVAQRLDIAGRTRMSKRSLIEAILQVVQQQPHNTEIITPLLSLPTQINAPTLNAPIQITPDSTQPTTSSAAPSLPINRHAADVSEKTPVRQVADVSEKTPIRQVADVSEKTPVLQVADATTTHNHPHNFEQTPPPPTPLSSSAIGTEETPPSEAGDWTSAALEAQNSRQLQQIARTLDIAGRTRMSKRSLIQAILDFFLARKPTPPASLPSTTQPITPAQPPLTSAQPVRTQEAMAPKTTTETAPERAEKTTTLPLTQSAEDTGKQIAQNAEETGKQIAQSAEDTGKQIAQSAEDTGKQIAQSAESPVPFLAQAREASNDATEELQSFKELETLGVDEDALQDEDDYVARAAAKKAQAEKQAKTIEIKPIPRDSVLQHDLEEMHAAIEPPPPPPPRTAATPYIDRGPTLPERYENTRIRAMIRDPQSVYVYWNTPEPPNTPWKIEARDEGGEIVHTFQVPPKYQSGYVRAEVSQIRMIAAHIQPPARPWFPVAAIDLKTPPRRLHMEQAEAPASTRLDAVSTQAPESWVRWNAEYAEAHPAPTPAFYDAPTTAVAYPPSAPSVASHTPSERSDEFPSKETQTPSPLPFQHIAPSSADLQRVPPWKQHPPAFPQRPFPPHGGAPSSASLIRPLPSSDSLIRRVSHKAAFLDRHTAE